MIIAPYICFCVSAEALRLQTEAFWMKHGRHSAQLEELTTSLEQWREVDAGEHDEVKLQGARLITK